MGTHITVMHGGHQIQSGSPRSLYNHPETPFLAGFIGETNLVPGVVKSIQGERAVISTDIGDFCSTNFRYPLKVSEAVTLSIRPESVELPVSAGNDSLGENTFIRPLLHGTYLGDSEQVVFAGPNQKLFKVNLFNVPDLDISEGSPVKMYIPTQHVLVLPAETDMGPGT